ncbi:dihydrodipicolinate synthase family protein [Paenochrobactrum pullorum]|uniref:dihydrodipicolinate synthase family protein n=1 Tax=Paenochrobactrum pullorum TaxID=1324351 RepID=UPI0035BC8948
MLHGLSAFPVTPVSEQGILNSEALKQLTERMITAGVHSIGLLGSTGAYMYLNERTRRQAIEVAQTQNNGRVPLVVGISAMRTDDAVNYAKDAKAMGATAGLLSAVSYTPLTEDEVFVHFTTVARQSGLPLCIYDNPSTTHFTFSERLIFRLAQMPDIVGIKNPLPVCEIKEHLQRQRVNMPTGFEIGYSGDWGCADALIAGADTWYSVLAGTFPGICVELTNAAQTGDINKARDLNMRLQPLWDVFKKYSSLRVTYEMLDYFEIADAALPKPLLPLSLSDRESVIRVLENYSTDFLR